MSSPVLILDVVLLVGALLLAIAALVKNAMPYLGVAVILIVVDLIVHLVPRG